MGDTWARITLMGVAWKGGCLGGGCLGGVCLGGGCLGGGRLAGACHGDFLDVSHLGEGWGSTGSVSPGYGSP